jgi:hypothetical protein
VTTGLRGFVRCGDGGEVTSHPQVTSSDSTGESAYSTVACSASGEHGELTAVVAGFSVTCGEHRMDLDQTSSNRKQGQSEAVEHREDSRLFNDRFGKAADLLGSDKAAARLAGV